MQDPGAFLLVVPACWLAGSLSGCRSDGDFAARVAGIERRAEAEAVAAHRCAADLRLLAEGSPAAASRALDLELELADGAAGFRGVLRAAAPEPDAGERWRDELARRERVLDSELGIIADATVTGPAALERVVRAVGQLRRVREGLCQARDVAGTLAAMAARQVGSAGETTFDR